MRCLMLLIWGHVTVCLPNLVKGKSDSQSNRHLTDSQTVGAKKKQIKQSKNVTVEALL